jgi:hypothetical protein
VRVVAVEAAFLDRGVLEHERAALVGVAGGAQLLDALAFTIAGSARPCGLWQLVHFTLPSTIGWCEGASTSARMSRWQLKHTSCCGTAVVSRAARSAGSRACSRCPCRRGAVAIAARDVVLAVLAAVPERQVAAGAVAGEAGLRPLLPAGSFFEPRLIDAAYALPPPAFDVLGAVAVAGDAAAGGSPGTADAPSCRGSTRHSCRRGRVAVLANLRARRLGCRAARIKAKAREQRAQRALKQLQCGSHSYSPSLGQACYVITWWKAPGRPRP